MILACHLERYIPPSQATYACYLDAVQPAMPQAEAGISNGTAGFRTSLEGCRVRRAARHPRPNRQTLNYDIICMSMVVEVAKAFTGKAWGCIFREMGSERAGR
jgi:hypothetical protein